MTHHYYNIKGEPISQAEGLEWYGPRNSERQVAKTKLESGEEVSTVFLVINHAFGDGPPILFETMIFGGEYDQECVRYTTLAYALVGHGKVCGLLQEGKNPWGE